MHELFLTAAVRDADFEMACAVLQGVTWMTARHNVYRVLFYAGQPQPKGFPVLKSLAVPGPNGKMQPPPHMPHWIELGKQLSRSSYVLQLAHEVSIETDFGNGNVADLNTVFGTVRWTDFPDILRDTSAPQRKIAHMPGQPSLQKNRVEIPDLPITQRKKIDIPEQKGLLAAMNDNLHAYRTELLQETFTYVKEDIEFSLNRYFYLPDSPGQPLPRLPPWEELRPLDPARKWTLHVKLNVTEDSQPENMKKAAEQLMRVKAEFDQLFEFKVIDRRIFDTRIMPPPIIPGSGY